MKYLKKFNELRLDEASDLGEDIAKDILPIFQKMRNKGQIVTIDTFDRFMKERGADDELSHSVMNHLVDMGFDFENDEDEDEEDFEPGDYIDFHKHGPLYIVTKLGNGYLVSKDEEQRYMGDSGDGFIIPYSSEGTIIERSNQ